MHIQLVCHHTTKHAIKSATTLVRKASLFDEPPKTAEQEMEGHNKGPYQEPPPGLMRLRCRRAHNQHYIYQAILSHSSWYSGFFLRITKPSSTGVSGMYLHNTKQHWLVFLGETHTDGATHCHLNLHYYFSVASSARSPAASKTGVECVWKPVIVLGLPAWPTTSTACNPDWNREGLQILIHRQKHPRLYKQSRVQPQYPTILYCIQT